MISTKGSTMNKKSLSAVAALGLSLTLLAPAGVAQAETVHPAPGPGYCLQSAQDCAPDRVIIDHPDRPDLGEMFTQEFADVPLGTQFVTEINWMATEGISEGWDDGTYRPLEPVNRDAIAAFTYRYMGEPTFVAPAVAPFKDVTERTLFHDAITWMHVSGNSNGWSDGTYRPLTQVSRDAMAAFLYRMAGEPAFTAPQVSPFNDLSTANPFYKEITWLASTGITTGWSDGTFRPLSSVNRDTMAAFLYRFDHKFGA